MEYPLFIGSEECGRASLSADGLYTRLEVRAVHDGGLVRVWLHGGGEQAYIGIMQRQGDELSLVKRFTRRDMQLFPQVIEYLSDSRDEPEAREPEQVEAEAEQKADPVSENSGLVWYSGAGGILTAFDGEVRLAAFPAKLRRKTAGTDIRVIEGREYMVFRY